jgi:hypothetical protein
MTRRLNHDGHSAQYCSNSVMRAPIHVQKRSVTQRYYNIKTYVTALTSQRSVSPRTCHDKSDDHMQCYTVPKCQQWYGSNGRQTNTNGARR